MRNLMKVLVLIIIVPGLILSSCKKSEEEANEFLTLKTYMADNGLDLGAVMTNADGAKFVLGVKDGTELDGKYIIDIRSAEKFAEGHIAGAHNVAFADILTAAASADAAGKAPVLYVIQAKLHVMLLRC